MTQWSAPLKSLSAMSEKQWQGVQSVKTLGKTTHTRTKHKKITSKTRNKHANKKSTPNPQ